MTNFITLRLMFLSLFLLLPIAQALASKEVAQDELRGIVVEAKPPLKVEGTKEGSEARFRIKVDSKKFCLGQIFLEDKKGNALIPRKVAEPAPRFRIGIGFGIGTRRKKDTESEVVHMHDKKETYIPKEKRDTGVGIGLGFAIPLFELLKGKRCQREVDIHFAFPQGKERTEDWNMVISVFDPKTKEEIFVTYKLSEDNEKIKVIEK